MLKLRWEQEIVKIKKNSLLYTNIKKTSLVFNQPLNIIKMVLNHIAIHQEEIKKGVVCIHLLFHILPRSIKILENLKDS